MKRKITGILAGIMTLCSVASANAAVYLNGTEVDDVTTIINETVMVPVRKVAEGLGCEVDWNNDTKTVTFTRDSLKATLVVGERLISIYENDELSKQIVIDTPADLLDGKTMVPVRIVAETFDCNVVWNPENKNVTITSNSPVVNNISKVVNENDNYNELIKEISIGAEKALGVLLIQYNNFSDQDKAAFSKACDNISLILQRVDGVTEKPITDEEAKSMLESANEAYDVLMNLANNYNVYEKFIDTAKEYMSQYFNEYLYNKI